MSITRQELEEIFNGNVPLEAEYEWILNDGSDTRTIDEIYAELRALAAMRGLNVASSQHN